MVTRYEVIGTCGGNCQDIEPHPHGEYVDYDDYDELEKKYNDLCEKVRECWMEIP